MSQSTYYACGCVITAGVRTNNCGTHGPDDPDPLPAKIAAKIDHRARADAALRAADAAEASHKAKKKAAKKT